MAETTITGLPAASAVAATDVLAVDVAAASATQKATVQQLVNEVLKAPGAIGGTTPAAGSFGTLSSTGNTTLGDASGDTVAIQAGTAALPTLIPNGDPNTGLWFPAADTVSLSTAGLERLRIDTSGNAGLKATPIAWRTAVATTALQVGTNSALYSQVSGGTFFTSLSSNWYQTTSNVNAYISTGFASVYTQVGGSHIFTSAASGAAGATISVAKSMTYDVNGNLGVGTSTFGTSADTVLGIKTGAAPTTGPADTIQLYSTDLSAGNTMFSLFTEGTCVNANTTAAATHRIAIRINGTVYYLLANTAA